VPTAMLPRALEPGPDQARSWLEEELRSAAYHRAPLLDRLVQWVEDRLADLSSPSAHLSGAPTVVTVLLTLLVAGLLLWVLPRVRRERSVRRPAGAVLVDPRVTAAQYRARAAEARGTGRYGDAVLDSFRAVARDLSERTLLDDAPGLTAHEVSVAAAAAFPGDAAGLARAADLFDSVRYGSATASRQDADDVAALDARLARERPWLNATGTSLRGPR
jgi:Domain of unknown function (DUF4129)